MRLLFFLGCVYNLCHIVLFPDELNACQGFLMIIFLFGKNVYICSVRKEQENLIFQPDRKYDKMSVKPDKMAEI